MMERFLLLISQTCLSRLNIGKKDDDDSDDKSYLKMVISLP
jgi:hypothetical protein